MAAFTTSDGVELTFDDDDSAPAGLPPVLLLHGFAVASHLTWGVPGTVDALADAGRRTITLDARGHGDSAAAEAYGEARMATDVREVLDHLDLETVDVVGHSMGAITALLVAAADQRVRRLVVSGVGEGVLVCGGLDQRQMPGDILAQAFLAETDTDVAHPLGTAWRAFAATLDANLRALGGQAQAMHTGGVDLAAITARTLVLAGDADNLAANPGTLAEAIADARVEFLTGADHLGTPSHPEFATRVIAFLAN